MQTGKEQHSAQSENSHTFQNEKDKRIKDLEEELSKTKEKLQELTQQHRFSRVAENSNTNMQGSEVTLATNHPTTKISRTSLVSKQAILDSLVNNTDEGILAVNTSFDIIEINGVLQQFLNNDYQIELKVGDNLLAKLTKVRPDYHERMVEYFGKTFRGERFRFDHMNAPQSNWRYVEVTFSPLIDQKGTIIGGAHFVRDMTRKVEESNVIKEIMEGSAQVSGENYFEYLTEKLTQLFQAKYVYIGRLREDETRISTFALRQYGDLIENQTYSLEGTPCQHVANKENTRYFFEVAKLFPDDQKLQRWQANSYIGVPITSPLGESLGMLVLIDCKQWESSPEAEYLLTIFASRAGTELLRQEAEEHIRQKQEQLDRISLNVPEMIYEYIVHRDGTDEFVHVSTAVNEIYELTPEDLTADSALAWNAIHPDNLSEFATAFQISALNFERFFWEGRIVSHRTKTTKWVKITSSPEKQKNGSIKWYGIIDDITQQKEYELQLEEAKERAEQAARAKEEFLATMSHEIRTPLNAIVGLCELLLKKAPKPEQIDNLKTLKFSSSSLMHLINDVLDFSKLEADKITLIKDDFNLRNLLSSLEQAHQSTAKNKQNKLQFSVGDAVPKLIQGDEGKLAQVLNNLLSNALKFTDNGVVLLSVDKTIDDKGVEILLFKISDSGIGIPSEKLDTIFEKFTQADSTTVRKYGGTGLGLSISKRLLELMESDIRVESTDNEGSTFSFSLKLKPSEETKSYSSPKVPDKSPAKDISKLKLLIVEDEAVNRMVLTEFLQEWGIAADEAVNGEEAIKKVQQADYDVVLMDIRMPIVDGYTATEKIRSFPQNKYKQLPIIAFTADITSTKQTEYANLFSDFVTKPFDPEQLRDLLFEITLPNAAPYHNSSSLAAVSFAEAESTFLGKRGKIKNFYKISLKTLVDYKREYIAAVEQNDGARLKSVIHKSKLLFSMFKLDWFSQDLSEQIDIIDRVSEESIFGKSINDFDSIIDQIYHKHEELNIN